MRAGAIDRIGCVSAAALAVVSAGWFGFADTDDSARAGSWAIAGVDYRAVDRSLEIAPGRTWTTPEEGKAGARWRFELFTPPTLFFDRQSGEIRGEPVEFVEVPPPEPLAAMEESAAKPAVRLERVEQPRFRLQLTGYVGEPGREYGIFENVTTGETLLAQPPQAVPALGLAIEKLVVGRTAVTASDGTVIQVKSATAFVRDDRTGDSVTLTDSAPRYVGEPVAKIDETNSAEPAREVHRGDEVTLGGIGYRVVAIRVRPAAVELEELDHAGHGRPGPTITIGGEDTAREDRDRPSI